MNKKQVGVYAITGSGELAKDESEAWSYNVECVEYNAEGYLTGWFEDYLTDLDSKELAIAHARIYELENPGVKNIGMIYA